MPLLFFNGPCRDQVFQADGGLVVLLPFNLSVTVDGFVAKKKSV
jgi:hypothetical protein